MRRDIFKTLAGILVIGVIVVAVPTRVADSIRLAVRICVYQRVVPSMGVHPPENNFDELKNQWGWGGFTTHDRKRCQTMARINALVYNWWNIFMRLGIPEKHAEAITSRPLALQGIARLTRHANQTTVEITSTHSKASMITEALNKVSSFLKRIKTSAEQLTQPDRWRLILSKAYQIFLRGRVLAPPLVLAGNTS